MNLAGASTAAHKALRGIMGLPVFTWKGRSIPCTPSTLSEANSIALGGVEETVTLTLYCLMAEFRSVVTADSTLITIDSELYTMDLDGQRRPVVGRKVTFAGSDYRVMSTRVLPCQSVLVLSCGPVTT